MIAGDEINILNEYIKLLYDHFFYRTLWRNSMLTFLMMYRNLINLVYI